MNKLFAIILIFTLICSSVLILHKQTSGGKKVMPVEKEIPLLESLEEIKAFSPVATSQYSEPIGPVRSK